MADATCEGCGRPGATVELWYPGPTGSHPVSLHRDRACALAARERLGGRPFLSKQDTELLVNMRAYGAETRRLIASEGKGGPDGE